MYQRAGISSGGSSGEIAYGQIPSSEIPVSSTMVIDTGLTSIKRFICYGIPTTSRQIGMYYDAERAPGKYGSWVSSTNATPTNIGTSVGTNSFCLWGIQGGQVTLRTSGATYMPEILYWVAE